MSATLPAAQPGTAHPIIWVVEDSPQDFAVLERALSGQPASLRRWTRAEEAFEAFASPDPLPDLVIVDLHLPGADGAELIKRLRGTATPRLREVPVCVLTSSTREADRQRCLEAGADDYRIKPRRAAEARALAAHALALASGTR